MNKTLLIVESPGKIEKIKLILGNNYDVIASYGHIIDLDGKCMSIDLQNSFEPQYVTITGKQTVISDIKKAVQKSTRVFLSSDEDREGEMIAWSLAYKLGLKNPERISFNNITKQALLTAINAPKQIDQNLINAQKSRRILDRIVGYELSPILWNNVQARLSAGRVQSVIVEILVDKENEIKKFYKKKCSSYFTVNGVFKIDNFDDEFNANLYSLKTKNSEDKFINDDEKLLDDDAEEEKEETSKNKKSKNKKDKKDKTTEEENIPEPEIEKNDKYIVAKIENYDDAKKLMLLIKQSIFKIGDTVQKESSRNPSAPFTTSSLQQDAGTKLKFNIKKTMQVAQNLYEKGYITYMRTDSPSLSKEALDDIKKYILENFDEKYYRYKQYQSGTDNTQEAHEAIRPCHVETICVKQENKIGYDEQRLYTLIRNRTIASQMSPAKFNIITININISKIKDNIFITSTEELLFDGYLAIYQKKEKIDNISENSSEENITQNKIDFKKLVKNTILEVNTITAVQEYLKPPQRYSEVTLVKKINPKNLNIGRPATTATVVNKIIDKGYVKNDNVEGSEMESQIILWNGVHEENLKESSKKIMLGKESNKLIPTNVAMVFTEFLVKNFPEIMDYKFTADMERNLDKVASGKLNWITMLSDFYQKFHPRVVALLSIKPERKLLATDVFKVLGKHPEKDKDIDILIFNEKAVLRMFLTATKKIYADIVEPFDQNTITLEDAVILINKKMSYPKLLGNHDGNEVYLNLGKFGFYVSVGKTVNFKVENGDVSFDDVKEKIIEKSKNILGKFEDDTRSYTILVGPYGNFISIVNKTVLVGGAKKNTKKTKALYVKFPKDEPLDTLTIERLKIIIKEGFENKKKGKEKKTSSNGNEHEIVQKDDKQKKPIIKKVIDKKVKKIDNKTDEKKVKEKKTIDKKVKKTEKVTEKVIVKKPSKVKTE